MHLHIASYPKIPQTILHVISPTFWIFVGKWGFWQPRWWNTFLSIIPVFHHLPKLHKTPVQGRPIVAGIGSRFERLGHWVDQFLQPLVERLPGYIKDIAAVLNNLQNIQWLDNYSWMSLDVKSLYSCIPHELALEALRFHLWCYSSYNSKLKEFIVLIVDFLLKHHFWGFW